MRLLSKVYNVFLYAARVSEFGLLTALMYREVISATNMLKSNVYLRDKVKKRRKRKATGLCFLKEKSIQTFNRIKGVFSAAYNWNLALQNYSRHTTAACPGRANDTMVLEVKANLLLIIKA